MNEQESGQLYSNQINEQPNIHQYGYTLAMYYWTKDRKPQNISNSIIPFCDIKNI